MVTLIDTHRLISDLKEKGFSDRQAEGIADAIRSQDLDHLATKADLREEVRNLEIRLIKWVAAIVIGQVAVFAAVVEWILGR